MMARALIALVMLSACGAVADKTLAPLSRSGSCGCGSVDAE